MNDEDIDTLGVLVSFPANVEKVCYLTGLNPLLVGEAFRRLVRRDVIRPMGGGLWAARQGECARCGEQPRKDAAVEFDPETLRWFHDDCWQREVGINSGINLSAAEDKTKQQEPHQ